MNALNRLAKLRKAMGDTQFESYLEAKLQAEYCLEEELDFDCTEEQFDEICWLLSKNWSAYVGYHKEQERERA